MSATDMKRRRLSPHFSQQRRAVNRAGGPLARLSTRAYFMGGQGGHNLFVSLASMCRCHHQWSEEGGVSLYESTWHQQRNVRHSLYSPYVAKIACNAQSGPVCLRLSGCWADDTN